MDVRSKLIDQYLPPDGAFALESLIATTYNVQWEFVEEDLLPVALGVRAPTSRMKAFRAELERRLSACYVSILYDPRSCDKLGRLSARVDAIPILGRKQHAKISLLLFSRPSGKPSTPPERRARLILGSANLTWPGFRENIEVVSALEFGGKQSAAPALLQAAVDLTRKIAASISSDQLRTQLEAFETFATELADAGGNGGTSVVLVDGGAVVTALRDAWAELAPGAQDAATPDVVTIVSPFWPEGDNPAAPVVELVRALGTPARLELVCSGDLSPDRSRVLPILPRRLPQRVKEDLDTAVAVRPARLSDQEGEPASEDEDDATEDLKLARPVAHTEQPRRALHAKIIAVRGRDGCAVYIGSSNCTRRGISTRGTAALNWEAGLVYRLGARETGFIDALLDFAGPPIEVSGDAEIDVVEPTRDPEMPVAAFLREVVANRTRLSIRFASGAERPADLQMYMADARDPRRRYLVFGGDGAAQEGEDVEIGIESCSQVDDDENVLPNEHVGVENLSATLRVKWDRYDVDYPVRFDDKATLPAVPGALALSEAELIRYFLTGRDPWADGMASPDGSGNTNSATPCVEEAVDTRRILSYFMRTFVDALPGIESAMMEGARSRPALHATLLGPTSPVALVERAVESIERGPGLSEPKKTPIAVAFQIAEILAAMARCRSTMPTQELREEFLVAIEHCRSILDNLWPQQKQLEPDAFKRYRRMIVGGGR